MNRLGIFVFYDKEGIVDGYVQYLLKTMREHVSRMVVVCNGILTKSGEQALKKYADELYLRENKGFDAMALKMAFTDYLGWEKVTSFDEAVFFNDTFYGPLYPWQEVFDAMEGQRVDFWGLTKAAASADYFSCYQKKLPAYIQSFFYAFRRQVLCHPQFQEYWDRFDSTGWIFSDVTNRHEKEFTRFLETLGFSWNTYVEAEWFESADLRENFVQYYYIAYQLISEYRCPFIKRKNFIMKHLTDNPGQVGDDTAKALEYIEKQTTYDTGLIWENLLRLYDMQDIRRALNLNYIVPAAKSRNESVLLLWLSYERCLPQCLAYVRRLDREFPIYIYSASRKILETVQEQLSGWSVICIQKENKDMYHFIYLECQKMAWDYEYLIFLHDVDYYAAGYFQLQQYSLLRHLWDSLLDGQGHVDGVEALFQRHERLGLLTAPQPLYGSYFSSIGSGTHPFFAFCCRGEAIKSLDWEYSAKISGTSEAAQAPDVDDRGARAADNDAMETLIHEIQRAGYYTAGVMNACYAEAAYGYLLALLERMLRQSKLRNDFSDFDSYLDSEVETYARRFSRVLIYGAGENGCRTAHLLESRGLKAAGFLVSDGQTGGKERYGYPVMTLSELKDSEDLGVVLSVASTSAQKEILAQLNKCGITDVFIC